jgi:hypothetical protein
MANKNTELYLDPVSQGMCEANHQNHIVRNDYREAYQKCGAPPTEASILPLPAIGTEGDQQHSQYSQDDNHHAYFVSRPLPSH